MNLCPAIDDLVGFLTESPGASSNDGVRSHVRGCWECQDRLNSLSDDPELRHMAADARRAVARHEDEVRRLVEGLRPGGANAPVNGAARASTSDRFTFLGPPRREGDLGVLGGYSVRRELGRGGMGIVLLGFDETLRRDVALKILRPELADDHSRARFVSEAQAAALVKHDHVVGVYGVVDPCDGPPYCALEFLAGPSLAERIHDEGRIAPREAAALAAQVADGLAAAHEAGLIHSDVKPSNILSDATTGRAKIADFGLRRRSGEHQRAHPRGRARGHAGLYELQSKSPGLKRSRRPPTSHSLGATLWPRLLIGEPPFLGAPHVVLQKVLLRDAAPMGRSGSSMPPYPATWKRFA